jgi:hypothetical protein
MSDAACSAPRALLSVRPKWLFVLCMPLPRWARLRHLIMLHMKQWGGSLYYDSMAVMHRGAPVGSHEGRMASCALGYHYRADHNMRALLQWQGVVQISQMLGVSDLSTTGLGLDCLYWAWAVTIRLGLMGSMEAATKISAEVMRTSWLGTDGRLWPGPGLAVCCVRSFSSPSFSLDLHHLFHVR